MADNNTIRQKTSKGVGAMLGAAFGDALGWPNERIAKSNASKQTQGRLHDFKRWTRRSGGRFFPHEEIIEEGEYSDDTQLILCLSRSLQKGEVWWEHFTQVELPFWSVYERGGGGATKRAVESWLDGVAPWSPNRKPQDVKRYYDAGGNGVAMRVLPHVLRLGEKEFPKVATNIFLDGIATHGHPRALVGALAYGFSLWAAFRKDSKLAYGELVEELIKNVDLWSALPTTPGILQEWRSQAEKSLQDYMKLWESAKAEVMEYLEVCRTELSKGALSLDDDVLKKLQCFNSKINGAGTVAAVASVYLASRHAADPINGVVKAAFAIGSDTDTIASMTGGLLGCVNGTGWLSSIKQGIQDAPYVEKCASCLAVGHVAGGTNTEAIRRTFLKKWIDDVFAVPDSREIYLPDRRMAKVSRGTDQVGRSGKFKVEFLKFTSEDGQTIYINKISKGNFGIQQTSRQSLTSEFCSKTPERQLQLQLLPKQSIFGPKLPVASMEKSIDFYKDLLGFTIKKESREAVVFHQGLVLVPASYTKTFPGDGFRTLLYVEVADVPNRFKTVAESSATIVTKIGNWGQSARRFFRCLDPDGNLIEVFEKI
jgi:ADP-ribosylglycohydrolase/catechol 2,3-dioxygenase-like lactoylglutathione lyase family enzyme